MHKLLILLTFILCSHAYATISTEVTRDDYVGNGSADTFSYSFKIFADDELRVVVRNTSTNALTTLTIDTDYTVTDAGETAGGTVVLVDNSQAWLDAQGDLDTGYNLSIIRDMDLFQETDIRNQGSFLPESHEDQFDYLTMLIQQQEDVIDKSLKLPETEDPDDWNMTISYPLTADFYIKINSTADGFEAVDHNTHTLDSIAPTSAAGDIIVYDGASNISMSKGENGQFLTVDTTSTTNLDWVTIDLASITTLSTSGDIYTYNSDTSSTEPLAIGSNDTLLIADDGTDRGVRWGSIDSASVSDLTTKGDLATYSTSDTRLPVGSNSQLLMADSTTDEGLQWTTIDSASVSDLTTKGDIPVYSSSDTRLPVGSNGQVLVVSSAQTEGIEWATLELSSITPTSAVGDIIYADSPDSVTRLAVGSNTQILTLVDGVPTWAAPAASGGRTVSMVYGDRDLADGDDVLIVSTDADDGGVPLITLYTAVGNSGDVVTIKNISVTIVSLAPQEGETIDDETAQTLGEMDAVDLFSDGERWLAF